MVSALLLILVLMPLIGVALNDAFSLQAKNAVKNELSAYVYSVLAVTEVENDQLQMPEALVENQFNVIQSGLYALISTPNKALVEPQIVWQSPSFLGINLPTRLPSLTKGDNAFEEISLNGKPHLMYSFSVSFEQVQSQTAARFPITIHIIKDQTDFLRQVAQFSDKTRNWLLILTVFLLVVQLTWLLWTLRPLAKFKHELEDVEQGRSTTLSDDYPAELQAVAKQLNALLATEQNQRKRYRNALSDLAHSLKTPLAVIQSQKDLSPSAIEQITVINRMIGHQLKRAQSAAGSAWHLGITVDSVATRLVRTLGKIYPAPLNISSHIDESAIFKGDEADLAEILGNLLDNACKAAHSKVRLKVSVANSTLLFIVEDDGPGISQAKREQIFERGTRADTYQHGHGIGLAIVRDLTDSYQGTLEVSDSDTLGGAKFSLSFPC